VKTSSDVRALLKFRLKLVNKFQQSEYTEIVVCGQNEGYIDLIDIEGHERLGFFKIKSISHVYQVL